MNQFGEATANVNLNIESEPDAQGEPPTFVEKPSIKWEEGASRVLMIALVKADPKPTAAWSKGGVAISSAGKFTATVVDHRPDVYRITLELRVLLLYHNHCYLLIHTLLLLATYIFLVIYNKAT